MPQDPLILGNLTEVALAFNIAYLALPRFRHRERIYEEYKKIETEFAHSNLPEEALADTAWASIERIGKGESKLEDWQNRKALGVSCWRWYHKVLAPELDRSSARISIAIGTFLMIALTALSLIDMRFDASHVSERWGQSGWTELFLWMVYGLLLLALIVPTCMVYVGRECIHGARECMRER